MRSEDINWFKNISNESACHSLKENQCKFHEMATNKFSPFSFIPVNNYSFEKKCWTLMYWSWNNTTIKFYCKTQEHILVMKIKKEMAFKYVKFAYRRGTCTSLIAVTL